MAYLTPKDGAAIMNLLVKQATGQQAISVVDSSTFVSAGELVWATGKENVFNSLNIVLGRTIIAVRKYDAKLTLMDAINTGVYSNRLRKISYYSHDVLNDGDHNTDLYTNLADGYTSGDNGGTSTKSQYEQVQKKILELSFGNSVVWQHGITIYEDQLQAAFRDLSEFTEFVSGYLLDHQNDIESTREAWNRMILLNKIGQVYDMSSVMTGSARNLRAEFNTKFGTSHSVSDLLTTYRKEFLAFFVSEFKKASEYMTERSANYHWPVTTSAGEMILRHTPYADQRVYLLSEFITDSEAYVLPEIFNPQYLDIKTQYEKVGFWQNENSRGAINVTPAVINTTSGQQVEGAPVELEYVIGCIADKDSMVTNFQLESARTSPLEARKGYRTTWLSIEKGAICDPTENFVLFYMS